MPVYRRDQLDLRREGQITVKSAVPFGLQKWLSKNGSDYRTIFCRKHHAGAKLKAKTNYAAILFSEHNDDKRYKHLKN